MTTRPPKTTARLIAIICLYAPAIIMLGSNSLHANLLEEKLLFVAILLLCIELARMAWVDLHNIALIKDQQTLSNADELLLTRFQLTVYSTVVLELLGFYGTRLSPQSGALFVIFSQLWFNLLAGIQLWPVSTNSQTNEQANSPTEQPSEAIEPFGIAKRVPVLSANTVALTLLVFWPLESARVWLALSLLTLVILFLTIKYVAPIFQIPQSNPEKHPYQHLHEHSSIDSSTSKSDDL